MKSLADASFFRAFDAAASAGNPGLKRATWSHAGASWRRERHSFAGTDYTFANEVFVVTHAKPPTWSLVVVQEHWWGGVEKQPMKSVHWARPMAGRGPDILSWLREQER